MEWLKADLGIGGRDTKTSTDHDHTWIANQRKTRQYATGILFSTPCAAGVGKAVMMGRGEQETKLHFESLALLPYSVCTYELRLASWPLWLHRMQKAALWPLLANRAGKDNLGGEMTSRTVEQRNSSGFQTPVHVRVL